MRAKLIFNPSAGAARASTIKKSHPRSRSAVASSGTILLMTLLGGMHTFIGPVAGVGVFLYAQNKLSWTMERWELVVGILFMALILIFPDGIAGTIKSKYLARKTVAQEMEEAE